MSEESYIHAVQRAELLGQTPPTQEEWAASNVEVEIKGDDDEDAVAQELDQAEESATRIGGGLDELNSILTATQRKINRFKSVCGSLGTLLKVRVASRESTPVHKPAEQPDDPENVQDQTLTIESSSADGEVDLETVGSEPRPVAHKKIDINEKMGSHLDKLDSMISKAERAQGSMQHQTKMMKKFISK